MKNSSAAQNLASKVHDSSAMESQGVSTTSRRFFSLPLSPLPILLFIILGIMNHIALGGGRFTMALNSVALGYSSTYTGIFIACFSIAPMLLSFKAGQWIHQVGVREPMLKGSILVVSGIVATFLFPSFLTFLIAPVVIGMGFMLYQLSTQHMFGFMASPEARLRNFSWLALGYSASAFIGPPIAGYAIHSFGFRMAFGILCIFPIVSALTLHYLKNRIPKKLINPNEALSLKQQEEKTSLSDLLSDKGFRTLMFMNLLIAGSFDTNQFLLPLYGRGIQLTEYDIGLIVGTFAVASFIIRMFLPIIQRFVSSWNIVRIAAGVTAACFFIFPLIQYTSGLYLLAFTLGLALGSCQPNLLSLVYSVVPTHRISEAIGVRLSILNTCQVILPIAFGLLLDLTGFIPIFWVMSCCLLYGATIRKLPNKNLT